MNKKRIEQMNIAAMKLLEKPEQKPVSAFLIKKGNIWKVPSKFNGYVASFGPSVKQAGLLQTLASYSRADGDGKDRKYICDFMKKVLNSKYLKIPDGIGGKSLYKYTCQEIDKGGSRVRIHLKRLIIEAAIACKLAMKTFPVDEKDQ